MFRPSCYSTASPNSITAGPCNLHKRRLKGRIIAQEVESQSSNPCTSHHLQQITLSGRVVSKNRTRRGHAGCRRIPSTLLSYLPPSHSRECSTSSTPLHIVNTRNNRTVTNSTLQVHRAAPHLGSPKIHRVDVFQQGGRRSSKRISRISNVTERAKHLARSTSLTC